MRMAELMALLAEHGISPHAMAWGAGRAKTPEKLLEEVNKGECELISVPNRTGRKRLLRRTHIGMVEVYRDLANGKRIALAETAHVRNLGYGSFASPQSFVDRKLDTTLTEKALKGETPLQTSVRALEEELRITITQTDIKNLVVVNVGEMFEAPVGLRTNRNDFGVLLRLLDRKPCHPPWRPQQLKYIGVYPSVSYPGLLTESKAHWLLYFMRNPDQFSLGYHDRDGTKLTTYDWRDTQVTSRR
jgi:hypothetical protein